MSKEAAQPQLARQCGFANGANLAPVFPFVANATGAAVYPPQYSPDLRYAVS